MKIEFNYNMEETVPSNAKKNFRQNFRHASAYHHQWLNEKKGEGEMEEG